MACVEFVCVCVRRNRGSSKSKYSLLSPSHCRLTSLSQPSSACQPHCILLLQHSRYALKILKHKTTQLTFVLHKRCKHASVCSSPPFSPCSLLSLSHARCSKPRTAYAPASLHRRGVVLPGAKSGHSTNVGKVAAAQCDPPLLCHSSE